MRDLFLIGVHESGEYVVLGSAEDDTEYRLPLDDTFREAARFESAPGADAKHPEPLRPADVQALIRAGLSTSEAAARAGWTEDKVRRFEGPVLAEREHVARLAGQAHVRGHSVGQGVELRELVEQQLVSRDIDPSQVEWDSRRGEDGQWIVTVRFVHDHRTRLAQWRFSRSTMTVTAMNTDAVRITQEEPPSDTGRGPIPPADQSPGPAPAPLRRLSEVRDASESESHIESGTDEHLVADLRERSAARNRRRNRSAGRADQHAGDGANVGGQPDGRGERVQSKHADDELPFDESPTVTHAVPLPEGPEQTEQLEQPGQAEQAGQAPSRAKADTAHEDVTATAHEDVTAEVAQADASTTDTDQAKEPQDSGNPGKAGVHDSASNEPEDDEPALLTAEEAGGRRASTESAATTSPATTRTRSGSGASDEPRRATAPAQPVGESVELSSDTADTETEAAKPSGEHSAAKGDEAFAAQTVATPDSESDQSDSDAARPAAESTTTGSGAPASDELLASVAPSVKETAEQAAEDAARAEASTAKGDEAFAAEGEKNLAARGTSSGTRAASTQRTKSASGGTRRRATAKPTAPPPVEAADVPSAKTSTDDAPATTTGSASTSGAAKPAAKRSGTSRRRAKSATSSPAAAKGQKPADTSGDGEAAATEPTHAGQTPSEQKMAEQTPAEQKPVEQSQTAKPQPAKKPARSSRGRASVPSWDDIMFGSKPGGD